MIKKMGSFSYDSMRSYCSHIDIFSKWLKSKNIENIYVGKFSKDYAQAYLDYIYVDKKLSPGTWNNYLSFSKSLWNWFIEKNYCSENPFSKIKFKPEKEKERTLITDEWNLQIIDYFKNHIPGMELICGLIYNSFMRLAKICRTQLSDIHIMKNGIYLNGSKTKKARWCLLPLHLIEYIIKLGIDKYPTTYYLVSDGLRPGKKPLTTRKLDKLWHKMKAAIELPIGMKLYSY